MSVERGGRTKEQERAQLQQAEAKAALMREQLYADLRTLMPLPAFQRYVQHLHLKCGTFDSVEVLSAEAYRIAARRHVGVEIAHEMGEADRKAAAVLMAQMFYETLTPQES